MLSEIANIARAVLLINIAIVATCGTLSIAELMILSFREDIMSIREENSALVAEEQAKQAMLAAQIRLAEYKRLYQQMKREESAPSISAQDIRSTENMTENEKG